MNNYLCSAAFCFAFLAGCGSSSSTSDRAIAGDEGALSSNRRIETLEDFTATIVDRTIVSRNEDGTRDPAAQLVVASNMKVTGFTQGGGIDFDWYWGSGAFCRSGVSNLPDDPQTVELECQGVNVSDNIVNFIRDGGAGDLASSWFIE